MANIRQLQQPQHLPDGVLLQIQARASRSCHPVMKLVSKSWNSTMSSDELFTLRRDLNITEQWLYILLETEDFKLLCYSLDPCGVWRQLPASNVNTACSAAEVNGFLDVLGGSSRTWSSSVWRYDPRSNVWSSVASRSTPREVCDTGVIKGLLYAGGAFSTRWSGEVYDPVTDKWTPVTDVKFSDMQPVMVRRRRFTSGMVVLADRLCAVHEVTNFWRGGKVYDPVTGTWSDMPGGMSGDDNWSKRVVVVGGRLMSLKSCNAGSCTLREYDVEHDCWRVVASAEVPPAVDMSSCRVVSWNGQLHVVGTSSEDDNVMVVVRVEVCGGEGGLEFTVVGSRRFDSATELAAC